MNTILIVDDNKYLLEALALALDASASGYTILKAKNGLEALDILDRKPVAMVLTDLEMPVMNGYQLIEHKNRRHPTIPLFAMTANASPDVVEKLCSLGISRCLEKPFELEEVTRLIMEQMAARPILFPKSDVAARCATA